MKLIDQVISLSQAKRLKELGVRQDASHAAWLRNECHKETEFRCWPVEAQGISNRGYSSPAKGCLEGFSAFTVAELGVMLPYRMRDEEKRENPHLRIYRGENEWHVEYHQVFSRPYIRSYAYENLSDAMAHVLIHLLENKLITTEEVNSRLCA